MPNPRPIVLLALSVAALPLSAQDDFCRSPIGVSHLLTPGAATCDVIGGTTTVNLSGNAVIAWDAFALTSSQRLDFAFSNPANTVVNQVHTFQATGSRAETFVGGTLTSNGNVVILSPDNFLLFRPSARVTVGSLTASGLGGSSEQFFSESGDIQLDATPQTNPTTVISGEIATTRGGLIVAGRELEITGRIDSAGGVTAVTGTSIRLGRSVPRVKEASGGRQIISGANIRARGDIEFVAQHALNMVGEHAPGNGRGQVFARVDDDGQIQIGPAGLTIRGSADFSTEPTGEIPFIGPVEGDNAGSRSPAVNEFPALGQKETATRARPTGAAITARVPSSFTSSERAASNQRERRVASTSTLPVVRKRSFFRTRTTVTQKKD